MSSLGECWRETPAGWGREQDGGEEGGCPRWHNAAHAAFYVFADHSHLLSATSPRWPCDGEYASAADAAVLAPLELGVHERIIQVNPTSSITGPKDDTMTWKVEEICIWYLPANHLRHIHRAGWWEHHHQRYWLLYWYTVGERHKLVDWEMTCVCVGVCMCVWACVGVRECLILWMSTAAGFKFNRP